MTIEELAPHFQKFRDKTRENHPGRTRMRYPKPLKAKAVKYFKANPQISAINLAEKLGLSSTTRDGWFRSVKRDPTAEDLPPFIRVDQDIPQEAGDQMITLRMAEIIVPQPIAKSDLASLVDSIFNRKS